ncbi:hypothetical protein B0H10DRAFT_1960763 [Mycena sp. CBHHK59/15]|nr:hypothetical protein B0H10DRAFT_1960763 [Mycena sp. CBHHK59/15]
MPKKTQMRSNPEKWSRTALRAKKCVKDVEDAVLVAKTALATATGVSIESLELKASELPGRLRRSGHHRSQETQEALVAVVKKSSHKAAKSGARSTGGSTTSKRTPPNNDRKLLKDVPEEQSEADRSAGEDQSAGTNTHEKLHHAVEIKAQQAAAMAQDQQDREIRLQLELTRERLDASHGNAAVPEVNSTVATASTAPTSDDQVDLETAMDIDDIPGGVPVMSVGPQTGGGADSAVDTPINPGINPAMTVLLSEESETSGNKRSLDDHTEQQNKHLKMIDTKIEEGLLVAMDISDFPMGWVKPVRFPTINRFSGLTARWAPG